MQLNFHGFARNPDEITAMTGITPSKTWRGGDPIDKSSRTHASNGWRVSTATSVLEVEAGVDMLFEQIAPQWETLRQVSAECRVELSIVVYADEQIPAIHFRADQVQRLAELSGKIDVDVYRLSDD